MFSLRPVLKWLALLICLVPSLSVFAQQEEGGDDDSSLMKNYNALREEGQGFYLRETTSIFEKPDSVPVPFVALLWWCTFDFLSEDAADTTTYGYVGKAVEYLMGSSLENAVEQGAQLHSSKKRALSVSAVMVPTLGIFEGQLHPTHDDWVFRYWDNGSSTLPLLGWEGHDEGDLSPTSVTSALSNSGTIKKITMEEAANYLGMDVADMTPATCSMEYKAAWNATHVVPDPIDTNVTTSLEEELLLRVVAAEQDVAQLQADNKELHADNKELLLRVASIEDGLAFAAKNTGSGNVNGNGTNAGGTSMATFMKPIGTVVVAVIGLVALELL